MTTETDLERGWRVLGFDLALGSHYHQERRRFFERWNMVSAFLGVVLGSATAASLIKQWPQAALVAALLLTFIQGLNLVIGFSRMAWTHGDLYRRFIDLEMKWRETSCSEKALIALGNERRRIEQGEPNPMPYLVRRCHIDVARREGYPDAGCPKLGFFARRLAHYLPELA